MVTAKEMVRQLCPPLLWESAAKLRRQLSDARLTNEIGSKVESPDVQDLDIYWDEGWAKILEHWGEGNAWNEVQLLLMNCTGKVLDVACGTGRVMELLARYPSIEVTGCDISDLLIGKARERGIVPERLVIGDATKMQFLDGTFEYAYSIGSLEHFTESGIAQVVNECRRVTRLSSFHMVPIARDGEDHGWIKNSQSYFNNSVAWWLERFRPYYRTVHVLDSSWNDPLSIGKWFVCAR